MSGNAPLVSVRSEIMPDITPPLKLLTKSENLSKPEIIHMAGKGPFSYSAAKYKISLLFYFKML